jgi:hypothetical protein
MLPITVNSLLFRGDGAVSNSKLTGTVKDLRPLRQREYVDGMVLNLTLVDPAGDELRVFFFDAWANGLSFISNGDVLTLHTSFTLASSPQPRPLSVSPTRRDALLAVGGAVREPLVVCNDETEIIVEQTAEHGDTLELHVGLKNIDNPSARVKRKPTSGLVLSHHAETTP